MTRSKTVRALFVGGPMYDGLYERLPDFERETGYKVEIVAKLPHPELNARVKTDFGAGKADIDLLSTHTKYSPAQAPWLAPLDRIIPKKDAADLLPRPAELSRIDGRLMQIPRLLDVRLLYYRRDLFENPQAQDAYQKIFRRPLRVPDTWDELVDVATYLTRPGLHGFLFPGRDSGLFGTFYELLVSAGGELFTPDLEPAFDSPAGVWAVDRLAELHHRRRVTPSDLPRWQDDEVSAAFRQGLAGMVCDWPGSHYLYTSPLSSNVAEQTGVTSLPMGFTGRRAAFAGCPSFAIARDAPNPKGAAALLSFLTSEESQRLEARRGAIPTRASVFNEVGSELAAQPAEAHRWELLRRTMEEALIVTPRFPAYPACEEALWPSVQKGMTGALSPVRAVREAVESVARIVRDFKSTRRAKEAARAPKKMKKRF